MRVTLTVSGGLAPPMARRYQVEVDVLDERARASFATALDAALAEQPPPPNRAGRDLRGYDIQIVDGDREDSIVVEDGGIPPATRGLIDLIRTYGR